MSVVSKAQAMDLGEAAGIRSCTADVLREGCELYLRDELYCTARVRDEQSTFARYFHLK